MVRSPNLGYIKLALRVKMHRFNRECDFPSLDSVSSDFLFIDSVIGLNIVTWYDIMTL